MSRYRCGSGKRGEYESAGGGSGPREGALHCAIYIYIYTEIRRIAAGHTHVIHAVSDTEGSEVEAQVTVGEHGPDQKGNEMGAPIRTPIKTGWTGRSRKQVSANPERCW